MKESDFEKLCDGVKEAGAYRRGDEDAARITDLESVSYTHLTLPTTPYV